MTPELPRRRGIEEYRTNMNEVIFSVGNNIDYKAFRLDHETGSRGNIINSDVFVYLADIPSIFPRTASTKSCLHECIA